MLQYFLETDQPTAPTMQTIEEHGLTYAFNGKPAMRRTSNGPSGSAGYLLVDQSFCQKAQPEFTPQKQTWRPIPKRAAVWIGVNNDYKPAPQDFARPEQRFSHPVELLDGHKWNAPIAIKWETSTGRILRSNALPQMPELDENGNWTLTGIQQKYQQLWQIAEAFFDARGNASLSADEKTATLEFANVMNNAVTALATNYRLSNIEVSMLGLLDLNKAARVLDALIDWPTLIAWHQKKTEAEPDGSDLCNGDEDSPQTTDPPSQTSTP